MPQALGAFKMVRHGRTKYAGRGIDSCGLHSRERVSVHGLPARGQERQGEEIMFILVLIPHLWFSGVQKSHILSVVSVCGPLV